MVQRREEATGLRGQRGSGVTPETKEKVVQRLDALAEALDGKLTPDAVVDDAKNPASPLHPFFEWNDAKAAEEHRRYQARKLMTLRVVCRTEKTAVSSVRYVRDPEAGKGQGYVSVFKLKTDKAKALDALRAEFDRVLHVLERTRSIAAVLGLEDELESLIQKALAVRQGADEAA